MDTLIARGLANRNKPIMVFDWEKAAKLIAETKPRRVEAGLSGDWEWTGGVIYEDGTPIKESCTYLSSTWATPMLMVDGTYLDCWRYASDTPGWYADTKWPPEALALLAAVPSRWNQLDVD